MDGFIGRVELGSMTGSQFAAGRSYQGVDASPCIDGSMKGASRDVEDASVAFRAGFAPLLCGSWAFGPSTIAARSWSKMVSEK